MNREGDSGARRSGLSGSCVLYFVFIFDLVVCIPFFCIVLSVPYFFFVFFLCLAFFTLPILEQHEHGPKYIVSDQHGHGQ